jgi:hypothetical protein
MYKQKCDAGASESDTELFEKVTAAYYDIMEVDVNPSPKSQRTALGEIGAYLQQYKLFIFIAVLVVAIGCIVYFQVKDNKADDLSIKFAGAYVSADETKLIQEIDDKSSEVSSVKLTFYSISQDTLPSQYTITQSNQFIAELSTRYLDVIIMDKDIYNAYVEIGAFLPLDDILKDAGADVKNNLVLCDFVPQKDTDSPEGVYGIDVSDSSFFDDMDISWIGGDSPKVMIMAIASKSKHTEKAFNFIKEVALYK